MAHYNATAARAVDQLGLSLVPDGDGYAKFEGRYIVVNRAGERVITHGSIITELKRRAGLPLSNHKTARGGA